MTTGDPLANFPSLGDDLEKQLENLPPPEPLVPPGVKPPECTFCEKTAVYWLERIVIEVQTGESAKHIIETRIEDDAHMIYACMAHKDQERDDELAEGAHASVMHQTGVTSELLHSDVYWRML